MQVNWQKLFTQTLIWIAAEVLLTLLGLDNLADYSEFIFDRHPVVAAEVQTYPGVTCLTGKSSQGGFRLRSTHDKGWIAG